MLSLVATEIEVARRGGLAELNLLASTTRAPERDDGSGLAATVNGIDPSPWPFCIPTDTQLTFEDTFHVQSRVVDTPTVPLPPAGGNGAVGGLGIAI